MSARLVGRIDSAFVAPSTAVFFDALAAADQHARDALFNTFLARIAPTPETWASCCCGSELTIVDTAIRLTDAEMEQAAAELADQSGISDPDSPICRDQIDTVIRAINTTRARADQQFAADWRDAHAACQEDN